MEPLGGRGRAAVSSNANAPASASASALEDAYRRAAANLAAAAWGCDAGQVPPPPPRRRPLSTSAGTAFSSVSSTTTGSGTGSGAATPLVSHSPTQHASPRGGGPVQQQPRTQQQQTHHERHVQHAAQFDPDEVDAGDDDYDDDDYSRSSKVSRSSYDDHGDHHSHATAASSSSQSQSQSQSQPHPHPSQAQGHGGGGSSSSSLSQQMLRHVAEEEEASRAAPLGRGGDATAGHAGGGLLRRMTLDLRPTYAAALNRLRSSVGDGDGDGDSAMALDDERIRPILGAGGADDSLPMPPLHMEVDAGGVGGGVAGVGRGAAARRGSPHKHGRGAAAAAAAAVASVDGIGAALHGRQGPVHLPKDGLINPNPAGDDFPGAAATSQRNVEQKQAPPEQQQQQQPSPRQNKERQQKQQKKKKMTKEKTTTKKKGGRGSSTTGGKKKCLTTPSEPCSSSSTAADLRDNVEGNLIVHVGDVLEVPISALHFLSSAATSQSSPPASPSAATPPTTAGYEVIDLLGQGTFAQVFRCRRSDDGTHVAVKVVKNKPAYTRQAAVEVDIFRTLLASEGRQASAAKGGKGNGNGSPGGGGGGGGGGAGTAATTRDGEMPSSQSQSRRKTRSHWIQLQAYFFHHSHLCLVFELLGLNLYEVLKRRQFRGLKLAQVRDVVRQCLEGMKELAGWGIVHCDVKPENILMVHPPTAEDGGGNEGDGSGSANGDAGEAMGVVAAGGTDGGSRRGGAPEADLSKSPASTSPLPAAPSSSEIKIIDFGSATYEEPPASTNALLQQYHYQYHTQHTYIQSRFYRSPEVLVGLPYDSAIDMWSLGCVAAELFLGLPILPGMQEHDQLCRICEMIGPLPDWMMDRGSKSNKYFFKVKSPPLSPSRHHHSELSKSGRVPPKVPTPPPPQTTNKAATAPRWKLKSRSEYALSMQEETGTKVDVHQQPTNRYFKRKKLSDIVLLHGHYTTDDEENVKVFCHFLQGILDPDPWKRWTAQQALLHPFLTGRTTIHKLNDTLGSSGNSCKFWTPSFDPSICRRKLLCVEKSREKHTAQQQQQASKQLLLERRGLLASGVSGPQLAAVSGGACTGTAEAPASTFDADDMAAVASVTFSPGRKGLHRGKVISPEFSTSRVTAMTDAMSISSQTIPHSATVVTDGTLAAMARVGDSPSPPPSLSVNTQRHPYHLHGSAGQIGSDGVNHALPRHLPANGIVSSLGALSTDAFGNTVQQREQIPASTQHGLGDAYHQQIHQQQQLASAVMATNGTVGWMDYNSSFAASGSNLTTMPSPTMQGISGFYDPSMMPHFHSLPQFLPTPQNVSKLYQDQNIGQNLPIEGDLGYALQRPGVVPSMSYSNEPPQPYSTLSPQHHAAGSYVYSPQMAPTVPPPSMRVSQVNAGSRSSSVSSMTSPGRQRDRANCVARNSFGTQLAGTAMTAKGASNMSATSGLPASSPRSYPMAMHPHLDDSQRSSDFVAGFGGMTRGVGKQLLAHENGKASKSLSSASTGTRSLLAQQLEQHSALSSNQNFMQESGADVSHRSGGHLSNIPHAMHQHQYASRGVYDSTNGVPSSVPANPVPYPSQPGYYNYTTTSGTPLMMSAPSANIDLRTTAAAAQLQSNASMLGQAYFPVAASTSQGSFGAYGAPAPYPYHMLQPPPPSMLLSQNIVGSPRVNDNAYGAPAGGVPQGQYPDGNRPTQSQSHYYREMNM